jgi:uncharacterized membrane protein SpoIIM required for sporulation
MTQLGLTGSTGILLVLGQNVRALTLASLLAVFSFGTLIVIVLMVPVGLASFFMTQMLGAGIDPVTVLAMLIPHSALEIPAAMVAGAMALRLGAIIVAPPPHKTLGQSWMETLADCTRLWLAFVLPVLLLAAVVEVMLTPRIVSWLAGGG